MNNSKRQENMREAVKALKELLAPGLLGNYTWLEAIEVIAFNRPKNSDKAVAHNIFSIYIAESGAQPPKPEHLFLNEKSKKLKGLDGWSFRVTKRPVGIAELLTCIEHYGSTGIWLPPDQSALQVGKLAATPPMFCPPDSRTEVPLNAVLKNNFWAGSYVVELKDEDKSTLPNLVRIDALFEELSDWLTTLLPLNIARIPDRIGDVLFQIPANALIAEYRRPPDLPVELRMAWSPDITPRPVVGEYRVEQDGLIVSLARFDFPVGTASLHVPSTSGDIRFSVWDTEKQLLLAAMSVSNAFGGKWRIESRTSTPIEQPRKFNVVGTADTIETHTINLMEPAGGWRGHRQPQRPQEIDWRAARELKARMKQLVVSRKFVQYGYGKASQREERQRAIEDIRHLIRTASQGAIYLWDPYLSANDILNTLAFCTDAGTELRGLTSSKPSKNRFTDEETDEHSDEVTITAREDWIKVQQNTLNTQFISPPNMKLEFRMSWGIQGSFHDRFLIFPGLSQGRTRVWSLGASVNHIGAQHCIVQEVAYPEPVLQAFQNFWDQSDQPEHLIWKY